ncbi:MAG: ArnT family glycosyltransferase [Planctomycetota bacterium]
MKPGPFSRDVLRSLRDPLGARSPSPAGWTALLLVALFVAFQDLGGRSLHEFDTARWGTLAREMIRSGEWLVPTRYGEVYANKPPLYLWCVAGPAALVGEVTPFLVRLPSAIGFAGLVMATAWWGTVRTGSAAIGRTAALLALSSAYLMWLGREGRLDMLAAGLATGAVVFLDRAALGRGRRSDPWWAGVLLGAALLTKGPPLLLVPAAVLFVPSPGRSVGARLRAARPHVILGTAVFVALLWFVPAVFHAGRGYAEQLLWRQASDRLSGQGNYPEPGWYYLVVVPAVMAPWGIAYVVTMVASLRSSWRRTLGAAGGLALAAAIVFVFFSLVPTKHYRYVAPVVPPLAIALAVWISAWLGTAPHGRWTGALRGIAGAAIAGALAAVVVAAFGSHPMVAVLPPAAALALVGVLALLGPSSGDGGARARRAHAVGCVLLAVIAVLSVLCVLRYRFHSRESAVFNRRLAEVVASSEPVYTAGGMTPEGVFHGAPQARFVRTSDDLPGPADPTPHVVVCTEASLPTVRAYYGRPGALLIPPAEGHGAAVLRFSAP